MATTPEMLSSAPWATPDNRGSGTILKGFRTTLEQRWKEFDEATMQEAHNHPLAWLASEDTLTAKRNENADFKKAKAAFDEARTTLGSLEDDAALKNAIKWPGKLSITIQTLTTYLDKADKAKEHNTVLLKTLADLTSLKAQMTENTEDQRVAEVAKVAVATSAAAVAESALLVPDFSNAMGDGAREIMSEAGKEVASIKKNPLKKIAEFFGFSNESIISDMKEALSEKKSGGFEGVLAGIKIWFYGFLAKIMGTDIAKSLTPEEMKLAGMKPKIEKKVEKTPKVSVDAWENIKNIAYSKQVGYMLGLSTEDDSMKKEMRNIMQSNTFAKESISHLESYATPGKNQEFAIKYKISPELAKKIITFLFGDTIMATTLRKVPSTVGITFMDRVLWLPKDMIQAMHISEKIQAAPSMGDIGSAIHGAFADIFKQTDGKIENTDIQATLSELGINGETASFFLLTNISIEVGNPQMSTSNKQFLDQKLLPFWKDFSGPFVDRYIPENMRAKVKEAIKSGLQLKDIFQLYVLSKWEKDFTKLSSFQQTSLFAKLWGMMWDSPSLRWQTLDKELITGIFSSSTTFPPEVYTILGRTMESVAKKTMQWVYGALSEVWGGIPDLEKYAIAGLFTVFLFIGWRFRMIFSIVKWSMIMAVLSVIAPKACSMINTNKPLSEKLEKGYDSDIAGK